MTPSLFMDALSLEMTPSVGSKLFRTPKLVAEADS